MLYAISQHLSIESDSLIGMTSAEVVAMASNAGDVVSEETAQAIIDCAKADKEQSEKAAESKKSRKH